MDVHIFAYFYFYFFFPLVPIGIMGGTQLSVSSKAGSLKKGHPLSSEGVHIFIVCFVYLGWFVHVFAHMYKILRK